MNVNLINCPECGKKDVRDKALKCPTCGFVLSNDRLISKFEINTFDIHSQQHEEINNVKY